MMHSNNFNGGISNGAITSPGSTGWGIDRTGNAVFHKIDARTGGGVIRNPEGGVQITDDGIEFHGPQGSIDPVGHDLKWVGANNGARIGEVWGQLVPPFAGMNIASSNEIRFHPFSINNVAVIDNLGISVTGRVSVSGTIGAGGGVNLPAMTTAQMNAISSPPIGLTIYNTSAQRIAWYRGASNGGWMHVQGSTDRF